MEAACKIQYTFNWFFIDRKHIAYFNSGINPKRSTQGPSRPADSGQAKFEWRASTPPSQALLSGGPDRPDQRRPADQHLQAGALHSAPAGRRPALPDELEQQAGARLPRLRRRLRLRPGVPLDPARRRGSAPGSRARRRSRRAKLVDAMEDAGTVDLRGDVALPYALELIGNSGGPTVQDAVEDPATRGCGPARTAATRTPTAPTTRPRRCGSWTPGGRAGSRPSSSRALGGKLFDAIESVIAAPRRARPDRLGVHHRLVRLRQQGPAHGPRRATSRAGSRAPTAAAARSRKCRKALVESLGDALGHTSDAELYPDEPCEGGDAQWCNDAVRHTATGAITQPPIHWIDRPTFQQVVQIGEQP